jgi:hypothetical protein
MMHSLQLDRFFRREIEIRDLVVLTRDTFGLSM